MKRYLKWWACKHNPSDQTCQIWFSSQFTWGPLQWKHESALPLLQPTTMITKEQSPSNHSSISCWSWGKSWSKIWSIWWRRSQSTLYGIIPSLLPKNTRPTVRIWSPHLWTNLTLLPSAGLHMPFISGTISKNTSTIGQSVSTPTISWELVYFYFSA